MAKTAKERKKLNEDFDKNFHIVFDNLFKSNAELKNSLIRYFKANPKHKKNGKLISNYKVIAEINQTFLNALITENTPQPTNKSKAEKMYEKYKDVIKKLEQMH